MGCSFVTHAKTASLSHDVIFIADFHVFPYQGQVIIFLGDLERIGIFDRGGHLLFIFL